VGYDAGKKVKGRKVHALVDVEGLPLRVIVHSAGIQDRDGAALVLDKIRKRFPWLDLVWADAGYNAHQVKDAVARSPGLRLEIVKRADNRKGFVVLPRRWVVERTFSWFGRNRRLAKDYENLADTLAAFLTLAAIQFAIRRLAPMSPLRNGLTRDSLGFSENVSRRCRAVTSANHRWPTPSSRPILVWAGCWKISPRHSSGQRSTS
jgi:putative transposase